MFEFFRRRHAGEDPPPAQLLKEEIVGMGPRSETQTPSEHDGVDTADSDALRADGRGRISTTARTKDFRSGNMKREHDRMSRLTLTLLCLSLLINFVLANVIATALPLRRDIPYLVTARPSDEQVMQVEPLKANAQSLDLVIKAWSMRYVRIRHEVVPDAAVMNTRWGTTCLKKPHNPDAWECGFMLLHSSPSAYQMFVKANTGAVKSLLEGEITRHVDIIKEPVSVGDGVIQIEFALRDYQRNAQGRPTLLRESYQSALLWYEFKKLDVEQSNQFLNPFGFVVTRYERSTRQDNLGRQGDAQSN